MTKEQTFIMLEKANALDILRRITNISVISQQILK